MTSFDEEHTAHLLGLLPPAPEAWVRAAQVLPAARQGLDAIVERAERDAEYRATILADLESALAAASVEPSPAVVEHLRKRLHKA
jgi:hypothetical protein